MKLYPTNPRIRRVPPFVSCVLILASVAGSQGQLVDDSDDPPGPRVLGINTVDGQHIGLRFSAPLDPLTAGQPASYHVNLGNSSINQVVLRPGGTTVELTVNPPVGDYFSIGTTNLSSDGILAPQQIQTGCHSGFISIDVGNPDPAGSIFTSEDTGWDIRSGGSDLGGISDSFHFVHATVVGDFDVRARLADFGVASPGAAAGLMVRETLTPAARTAHLMFTSPLGSNQLLARRRLNPGGIADGSGFQLDPIPSGSPHRWLRLTRTGTTLRAFESLDAVEWQLVGLTEFDLGGEVKVGLAVSSGLEGVAARAQFEDFNLLGQRLGDEVSPALSIRSALPGAILSWPRTSRSFAPALSTNLLDWGHFMSEFRLVDQNFEVDLPADLLGQPLFIRLQTVVKVIPAIAALGVNAGMILGEGAGLSAVPVPQGFSLCNAGAGYAPVPGSVILKETGLPLQVGFGSQSKLVLSSVSSLAYSGLRVAQYHLNHPTPQTICTKSSAPSFSARRSLVCQSPFPGSCGVGVYSTLSILVPSTVPGSAGPLTLKMELQ